MTEEEARGYTNSPLTAVLNEPEPVDLDVLRGFTMEARGREMERRNSERAVEVAKAQARSVNESVRSLAVDAARSGHDVSGTLAQVGRLVDAERRRM